MKRFLTMFTAVLMAVVLCCSVGAAAEAPDSYYLEEMNADIALPSWEDYYFLYPDMPEDNQDLAYLELTPEEINEILIPNGILFDALYYDASHEIAVQVSSAAGGLDYGTLGEPERSAVITATTADLEQMGYTINVMEWVEGEHAAWLVIEFVLPGNGGWGYQYHTSTGEKTLMFTASSAQGVELTDEIRTVTANMALGTVFRDAGLVVDEPDPISSEPTTETELPTTQPDEPAGDLTEVLANLDVGRIVAGALIGAGAGVVVVAVIVVLLAVSGRKKGKQETSENASEDPWEE